jgi:DNA-directed RNA polymerase specialized sigma subunit
MTKEKLREYRNVIGSMRRSLKTMEEELYEMECRATKTTSVISDDIKGSKMIHDTMAEVVCRIVDKKNEINIKSIELYDLQKEVEEYIDSLEEIEREIFKAHYISLLSWRRIAVDTHYSERGIYRIHGEALAKNKRVQ